jgi:hypothetical protein
MRDVVIVGTEGLSPSCRDLVAVSVSSDLGLG